MNCHDLTRSCDKISISPVYLLVCNFIIYVVKKVQQEIVKFFKFTLRYS